MFESTFVCFAKYSFPIAKFMICITFERHDKTYSEIEKKLISISSLGGTKTVK